MGQVTIYVEDSALDATRRAAERTQVSVSQWLAKIAIEEKNKQAQPSRSLKRAKGFILPTTAG